VAEALGAAGNATSTFIASIDPVETLNITEDFVISSNEAILKATFDAKRNLLKTLRDFGEAHSNTVSKLYNGTLTTLGNAINQTTEGLVITKTVVANYTEDLSLENAQEAIANAYNTSRVVIEQTGSALLKALVDTKHRLNDFVTANSTANATATNSTRGVFDAIDGLIAGVAAIPQRINDALFAAETRAEDALEKQVEREEEEAVKEAERTPRETDVTEHQAETEEMDEERLSETLQTGDFTGEELSTVLKEKENEPSQ
jgi:hypothetical protein